MELQFEQIKHSLHHESYNQLRISFKDQPDPVFGTLLRRLLMTHTKFHIISKVTFHDYNGEIPSSQISHALTQIPVLGLGKGSIHNEGPCMITSSDIRSNFDFHPDLPIVFLAEGKKLYVEFETSETDASKSPACPPFIFKTEGKDYILETVSNLFDEQFCKDAVMECINKIKGWCS